MTTEAKTKKTTKRGEVATYSALVEAHDAGRMHSDLSLAMREALSKADGIASDEGTATVKITTTLTLVRAANGRTDVKAEYKVLAPQPTHPTTVLYATEGGTLSERDPRQVTMNFRSDDEGV